MTTWSAAILQTLIEILFSAGIFIQCRDWNAFPLHLTTLRGRICSLVGLAWYSAPSMTHKYTNSKLCDDDDYDDQTVDDDEDSDGDDDGCALWWDQFGILHHLSPTSVPFQTAVLNLGQNILQNISNLVKSLALLAQPTYNLITGTRFPETVFRTSISEEEINTAVLGKLSFTF